MGRFTRFLVMLFVGSGAACAPVHHDFSYTPNQVSQPARPSPLKVAVLPFVDKRVEIDEGSHAWSWLPLVPSAAETRDGPQDPGARDEADYYFPDLVAYTIALDLIQNGVGARVDLAAPALEDYDLVVHGTLNATTQSDRVLSYGLGPLGGATSMIGLPQKSKSVTYDVTYVVYDSEAQPILEKTIAKEWSKLDWSSSGQNSPIMTGFVETIQEANHEFVAELVQRLQSPPFSSGQQVVADRVRRFHDRLDPELSQLLTERDRVRAKPGDLYRLYQDDLTYEIGKRAELLESWRRVEERIIALQQVHVYETQAKRLDQIAHVRAAKRSAAHEQQQLARKHRSAILQPLAAAFVAGTVPTMKDANATGGTWNSNHWQQWSRDMSAALSVVPDAPPPPDLTPLLQDLDIDMDGLESAGGVIVGLRGNNVPELRRNFLARYSEQTLSVGEIQAEFMARQGL